MTVEVRFDDDGTDVQAVVRKSETVAAEAVPLFLGYWQTGQIPADYSHRRLDL